MGLVSSIGLHVSDPPCMAAQSPMTQFEVIPVILIVVSAVLINVWCFLDEWFVQKPETKKLKSYVNTDEQIAQTSKLISKRTIQIKLLMSDIVMYVICINMMSDVVTSSFLASCVLGLLALHTLHIQAEKELKVCGKEEESFMEYPLRFQARKELEVCGSKDKSFVDGLLHLRAAKKLKEDGNIKRIFNIPARVLIRAVISASLFSWLLHKVNICQLSTKIREVSSM